MSWNGLKIREIIHADNRISLGARPRDVMRLVLSRGMLPACGGAALGIGGALALLLAVALLACWLPTRNAMRVQPAVALRTE